MGKFCIWKGILDYNILDGKIENFYTWQSVRESKGYLYVVTHRIPGESHSRLKTGVGWLRQFLHNRAYGLPGSHRGVYGILR